MQDDKHTGGCTTQISVTFLRQDDDRPNNSRENKGQRSTKDDAPKELR